MASTDPKIATQGQWEDLADRVQSKAEIGTVLSTPSNAAYVDTNNIVNAAVTTSKIADGAVTADKIDFSEVVEVVGTTTGANQNYAIKFANGTMIACIRKEFSGISFAAWGGIYEHEFSSSWFGNWAVPFIAPPVTSYACEGANTFWIANIAGQSSNTTRPCNVDLCRGGTATNSSGVLMATGIGRWK